MADGISTACIALALSEEYGRDYFVRAKEPSFLQVCLIKIMAPFYFPLVLFDIFSLKGDKNFITKDKPARMTGEINCKATCELSLLDIRAMSKKLNVTINDVVTCAISVAMRQFFEE